MASAASVPSPSVSWISTQQAADALGVTERTIRRMCSERKVGSRVQREKGRKPFRIVNAGDVDRLIAEQARVTRAPDQAHDLVESRDNARVPTLVKPRELAPAMKPFLTLDLAADYSGLPARLLARMIRDQILPCVRFSGETYVKRSDLDGLTL
jgi:helix-turn-helix protein